MRFLFASMLALLLLPRVAYAAPLEGEAQSKSAGLPGVGAVTAPSAAWTGLVYCSDARMLSFIITTESFSQPDEAKIAIAQIVKREAESRGISICALARFSSFVAVYQYAIANPLSWHARQLDEEQWWGREIAAGVLSGAYPDATQGAMHFDSHARPGEEVVFVSGQIVFMK